MPDPTTQPNPAPSVPPSSVPVQGEPPGVGPDIDNELDDALTKAFSSNQPPAASNEEKPKPVENKVENNSPQPEQKKSDKPVAEDKPLPKPESLEKDPPKKQDGWTSLKNNYTRAHKTIEARDAEITKLKATLAEKGTVSQKEVDTLKSEIDELRKFRAMVDIQADPEFVSKYDQPIEKSVGTIKGMLKEMNVSQEIIDQIDFTNTKLMDDIINHVGQHKDNFTARKLQRKVEELLDLAEKRDETLAEHKDNHKKYIEDKKKETFTRTAEEEGKIIKRLESIAEMEDKDGNKTFPFLRKIEPKEGSTQLEIDQMNNHNRMVDLMTQKVQQVLALKTPEEKAEIAVAAVASHYLTAQLKTAVSKINSLQQELQKISAVSTETVSKKAPAPSRNGNGQEQDLDSALTEHFQRR